MGQKLWVRFFIVHCSIRAARAEEKLLRNHDCHNVKNPIADWDQLRDAYEFECEPTPFSKSLKCAATVTNWKEATYNIVPFELGLRPWFLARGSQECPLGMLTLNIVFLMECLKAEDVGCYNEFSQRIQEALLDTDFFILQGTAWPIFALLNTPDWNWPPLKTDLDFNCEKDSSNRVGGRWLEFRGIFDDPETVWRIEATKYAFSDNISTNFAQASKECLYGIFMAIYIKAIWVLDSESSAWAVYHDYMSLIWEESLHYIGASKWPIFEVLHQITLLKRHNFQLDFSEEELFGLNKIVPLDYLLSKPLSGHHDRLEVFRTWRKPFWDIVQALRITLVSPTPRRFIYVTMVYGKHNKYIYSWKRRAQELDMPNVYYFCLDDEAYQECLRVPSGFCLRGSISMLNKYSLLLIALQLGFDIMWLDFDIFLVKNPTEETYALARERKADLLIAYAWNSDCICNGFFFMKSTTVNVEWLKAMFHWLYTRPYEHDQRAFAAFLNYTENVDVRGPEFLPEIPSWFVFDVHNKFINWPDWTGNLEDMVLIHFMDGEAFSLYGRSSYDPSIPQVKTNPMYLFLSNRVRDEVDRTEIGGADWVWSVGLLEHFMMTARREKTKLRSLCGILPNIESAHKGYGWVARELNVTDPDVGDRLIDGQ